MNKEEKPKLSFKDKLAKTLATTAKQLIWLFALNGIAWIWCSYILAFMGQVQIAEALSSEVCKIVIGQMAFYLVTKTVENIFKYNNIFGDKHGQKEDNVHVNITEPEPPEPPSTDFTIGGDDDDSGAAG